MHLTCPSNDRLRQFLEGTVHEVEAEQILDHVENCPSCDLVVSSFESGQEPMLEALRGGLQVERLLSEPEFQQLRQTATLSRAKTNDDHEQADRTAGGRRLRDYRLLREVGKGGMGTVYQALHVHLGKYVALKVLPTGKLQSTDSVKRFKQEMRAVGRLDHLNVVGASDAGAVDGQHFLVMEWVEGADLARITREQGPLTVADACEIVRQAAVGLQHAHENGLVHRDVKPSNLMLACDGTVKVLDLGLAGINDSECEPLANEVVGERLTSVGQLMGTLDYMAPEQVTASNLVDRRADIYSLGATLFQLLTTRTPCGDRATPLPDRIQAVLQQPPLEIASLRDDVPAELCSLVRSMLAKSPRNRPQTAGEVARELSRYCRDANLVALARACTTGCDQPAAELNITDDTPWVIGGSQQSIMAETHPRADRSRFRRRVQVAVLAIALCGILAALWGITFRTRNGTVEVAFPSGVQAANVRVVLVKGGRAVRVIEQAGKWTIDVEAGRYQVELVDADEQFELAEGVLTVSSGKKHIIQIRQALAAEDSAPSGHAVSSEPTIEAIFRSGRYEEAANRAEREATLNSSDRPNHGRAALMWLCVSTRDRDNELAHERYEYHRQWLVDRWEKTGEAPGTIPRICCMRADPPGDLEWMLAAMAQAAEHYPLEAWQYAHSRMLVLYRLQRYEEAQGLFRECRLLAPRDRMRMAVDHLLSAMILNRMGRVAEGTRNWQIGLRLFSENLPSDGKQMSSKIFDFVEAQAAVIEGGAMVWQYDAPHDTQTR